MLSSESTFPRPRGPRRGTAERVLVTVVVLGGLVALLAATGPDNGWNFARVWGGSEGPAWRWTLLRGLGVTVLVSLGAMAVALPLGLLGGLARLSRRPALRQLGAIYVEVVRGTPLLVQLFIAVYCVGYALGVEDRVVVGVLTLGVFAGAYVTEIVRSAIESIDPGQTEAALSQGMTRAQAFRRVLFPQAVRRMLPPLAGELANLVKDSSLLSVVGVLELTKRADEAHNVTLRTFEVFLPVAVLYLAVTFPLSVLVRRLELRLASA
jgi:polar amino acid transport system permease protein